MKPYLQVALESIEKLNPHSGQTVIYLEAGHFTPKTGPDSFAQNSLIDSLEILSSLIRKRSKNVRLVLGILVDDLGLECGKEGCSVRSPQSADLSTLPNSLEQILLHPYVKRERLLIFSERNAKNRAIQRMRQLKKQAHSSRFFTEERGLKEHWFCEPQQGTRVTLAEKEGEVIRAQCPAIMAQHYADCSQKIQERFVEMDHLIIVDWSEMMDRSKVTSGARCAQSLFLSSHEIQVDLLNIFLADDDGEFFEIVTHTSQENLLLATK